MNRPAGCPRRYPVPTGRFCPGAPAHSPEQHRSPKDGKAEAGFVPESQCREDSGRPGSAELGDLEPPAMVKDFACVSKRVPWAFRKESQLHHSKLSRCFQLVCLLIGVVPLRDRMGEWVANTDDSEVPLGQTVNSKGAIVFPGVYT